VTKEDELRKIQLNLDAMFTKETQKIWWKTSNLKLKGKTPEEFIKEKEGNIWFLADLLEGSAREPMGN